MSPPFAGCPPVSANKFSAPPSFRLYSKHSYPAPAAHHQQHHPHHHHIPVKLEESPDLPPAPSAAHHHQHQHSNHPHHEHRHHKSQDAPLFRFGSDFGSSASPTSPAAPFTFMSQQWPGPAAAPSASSASGYAAHAHAHTQYAVDRAHYALPSSLNGHHAAMELNDDYDDPDGDELADLPSATLGGLSLPAYGSQAGTSLHGDGAGTKGEKQIRRRSSKACDQCRKSKCKCERGSPQDPCRNCVMLGTPCTFLGPSRKRGPPKGYIDAIEARLHQTEALIGILLGSKDSRARSVLEDISEDPLAKEIINRVDNSPYGHKGRARGGEAAPTGRSRPSAEARDESGLHSTHPSNEWQDAVIAHLNAAAASRNMLLATEVAANFGEDAARPASADASGGLRYPVSPAGDVTRPVLNLVQPPSAGSAQLSATPGSAGEASFRRQRRRLDTDMGEDSQARSPSSTSMSGRSRSPGRPPLSASVSASFLAHRGSVTSIMSANAMRRTPEMQDEDGEGADLAMQGEEGEGEDELAIEVGQLSLNEDEQVRFHGKMSGLHLLGVKDREDGRHEGGIWKFPKARVWPPLPPTGLTHAKGLENFSPTLPDQATQELLLELYWTYVHPSLPVVNKRTFMEDFRNGGVLSADSPYSEVSDGASPASNSSPANRRGRVPTVLLLAMFSIAARYSSRTSSDVPPPQPGSMWAAGDRYLEDAKVILDSTYAASRPSTCQALLLMGYREVGIGAMAQAWLYVGMAVRMAQDLGLHKTADQWSCVGRVLFTPGELQERRRVWYGCVVMDKYMSAYIGRPVAIFERDFDTELPSTEEPDELETWRPHPSAPVVDDSEEPSFPEMTPMPGRILSCFSESAKLSIILSMIMQCLYAIKAPVYRQSEFSRFEKLLSKWYLDLPDYLRHDPAASKNAAPLPHILTLHMQYWCTVLLLHRPFIRHISTDGSNRPTSSSSKDSETRASSRKNYDICVQAANQITSTVSLYAETHSLRRAPVYLCYYVFTAAIMHVATLMIYPDDTTARVGLNKTMDVLKRMSVVWGSAWRALELLQGSKVNLHNAQDPEILRARVPDRPKRSAEQPLDQEEDDSTRLMTSEQMYRQQQAFAGVGTPSPVHPNFSISSLQIPPAESSTYHSYDRWSSDNTLPTYAGSLSTSVLPQQYSTGLVDERISSGMTRHPERQGQRYPQYWNDYSALGQMDASYGVPVISDMVAQHAGNSQSDQSAMYVQDYTMFGNLPPSSHQ